MLLSNHLGFFFFFGFLVELIVYLISDMGFTVIVGWHCSCSPSSLSAAVQLLSYVILNCLTLKHTHVHTHYSNKLMEVFAKITLWSKRCFLFRAEAGSYIQWFVNVSRLRKSDRDILSHIKSLSFSLAFCSPHLFPLPKQSENVFILACI